MAMSWAWHEGVPGRGGSAAGRTGLGGDALPALLRLPGVYRTQEDTRLLAGSVMTPGTVRGRRVLDVCTGTGALALAARAAGARSVTAVDISRRSVANTALNARLNRTRVRAVRGDLFAPLAGETFDVVVCNPPYVPASGDRLPRHTLGRCWDAGRDGRTLVDRVCAEVGTVLAPAGVLLLVQSAVIGVARTQEELARSGLAASVVARARIPFGPVMRRRAPLLRRRGLIGPDDDHEEVVVLRAHRQRATTHDGPSIPSADHSAT